MLGEETGRGIAARKIKIMGLDTSHDCWHGPYSSFMRWREKVCECAGLGNIRDRIGFNGIVPWPSNDIIVTLLDHSDCEGEIEWQKCSELADRLDQLLPSLRNAGFEQETKNFIDGLRLAANKKQNVDFH